MIKVGAYRVAPSELEEIASACPGVAEVAVVGLPDPIWSQVPVAFVVPQENVNPPLTADAVLDYLSGKLPLFKRPREVRLITELPRTRNGKIDRLELMGMRTNGEPLVSRMSTKR
jgi:acyl-coenzyme A synthetase/AMP-(fatty) acid ligase